MNEYLEKAKAKWNAKADKWTQWDNLDSDEKFHLWFAEYLGKKDDMKRFNIGKTAKTAWDSAIDEYL